MMQDKKQLVCTKYKYIQQKYLTLYMQTQPLFFNPQPTQKYKILSVLDGRKAFTLQPNTHNLIIQDYTNSPSQIFNIYINDKTYAFVSQQKALKVQNQNKNDGGVVQADPGQFPSSYFQIVPVTKGEWANKACHIKTFAGKALDIKGGVPNQNTEICQWNFHGGNNQTWVITPIDQQPTQSIHHQTQPQSQQNQIQPTVNQVPAQFSANPSTLYKVVSVMNPTKAFTVDKTTNKLSIKTYSGDVNQKFNIYTEQNKFAFVASFNQWGLCIYKDSKQSMGEPVVDGSRHPSSWFEVVRASEGKWANKAYQIKTHAGNQGLDICGGKCEDGIQIIQYQLNAGENQLWLIVPADQNVTVPQQNQVPQQPQQPQIVQQAQVAANFTAIPNTLYKIVSVTDKSKAFTADLTTPKVFLKPYTGDASQKFTIYVQNNKFAFVNSSNQSGLCIFQDKKTNNADLIVDGGKHPSSWFELSRHTQGKWTNKAYVLKTHSGNRVIDASGHTLLQYDLHGGDNQLWLVLPADTVNQVNPVQIQTNPIQGQPQNHGTSFKWAGNLSNAIQNFGSQGPHVIPNNANGTIPIPFGSFDPNALVHSHMSVTLLKPYQNYIIYAANSNNLKAIDVSQGFTSFGNLILYSFHGAPNQRFVFEQEGNLYRIKSLSNGKYVRVTNDDQHDGMWIRTDQKGSKSELWSIIPSTDPQYTGKAAYHIRSVFGKALEVAGGSLENESKIQQAAFTGSKGQSWIIKEI